MILPILKFPIYFPFLKFDMKVLICKKLKKNVAMFLMVNIFTYCSEIWYIIYSRKYMDHQNLYTGILLQKALWNLYLWYKNLYGLLKCQVDLKPYCNLYWLKLLQLAIYE